MGDRRRLFSAGGLRFVAAGIVVINGFFPAIWILFTSLKSETELFRKPITYFPHEPTLKNYIAAAVDQPLFPGVHEKQHCCGCWQPSFRSSSARLRHTPSHA